MQNSRKHHLFHAGCGLVLMLAAACSGDDTDTSNQPVGTGGTSAGSTASGGRSGTTASSGGTRAPSGGSSSTTPTTSAGKGGTAAPSGSAGRTASDEDAGVSPDAGAPKGGAGGTTAAGPGAAGRGGSAGSAAGSGGSSNAQGATFTQVYALFTTNCALAGCHGAGRAGDNLSMVDKDTAYKNLVDAASVSCSGAKRVVAGDTDKSELVHTLQHTMLAGCARTPKMPDNKPMLAQSDIDLVVSWVKAGAKND